MYRVQIEFDTARGRQVQDYLFPNVTEAEKFLEQLSVLDPSARELRFALLGSGSALEAIEAIKTLKQSASVAA